MTFEDDQMTLAAGEFQIELIHMAGHKIDQTIVWLPEQAVLIASDLIFQNSYPYMVGCDVHKWIQALHKLGEYPYEVILPGHGSTTSEEDIRRQIAYFENGLEVAGRHKKESHPLAVAQSDPDFMRMAGWERQERFETNVEVFYNQAEG